MSKAFGSSRKIIYAEEAIVVRVVVSIARIREVIREERKVKSELRLLSCGW
jgi:hypothetical protein